MEPISAGTRLRFLGRSISGRLIHRRRRPKSAAATARRFPGVPARAPDLIRTSSELHDGCFILVGQLANLAQKHAHHPMHSSVLEVAVPYLVSSLHHRLSMPSQRPNRRRSETHIRARCRPARAGTRDSSDLAANLAQTWQRAAWEWRNAGLVEASLAANMGLFSAPTLGVSGGAASAPFANKVGGTARVANEFSSRANLHSQAVSHSGTSRGFIRTSAASTASLLAVLDPENLDLARLTRGRDKRRVRKRRRCGRWRRREWRSRKQRRCCDMGHNLRKAMNYARFWWAKLEGGEKPLLERRVLRCLAPPVFRDPFGQQSGLNKSGVSAARRTTQKKRPGSITGPKREREPANKGSSMAARPQK